MLLPHVRTDIVQYLKQSKKSHITRLQANYFANPYKSIYTKISAGIFEPMFAGYGGEIYISRLESHLVLELRFGMLNSVLLGSFFDSEIMKQLQGI